MQDWDLLITKLKTHFIYKLYCDQESKATMAPSSSPDLSGSLPDASEIFSLEHGLWNVFGEDFNSDDATMLNTPMEDMTCELCGELNNNWCDMVYHVHFWHQVPYSQACPCAGCVAMRLPPAEEDSSALQMGSMTLGDDAGLTVTPAPHTNGEMAELPATENVFKPAKSKLGDMLDASAAAHATPMGIVGTPAPAWTTPGSATGTQPAIPSQSDVTPAPHPPDVTVTSWNVRAQQQPLARPPDFTFWTQPQNEKKSIRENNLPYSMSQIEAGKYRLTPDGKASWRHNNTIAQTWNPTGTNPIRSPFTGRIMRYLPFMPEEIPMNTLGWQLYTYIRSGTTENPPVEVRYDDLYDRMDRTMTHSALSNRIAKWLAAVGGLPMNVCVNYNWPSRHSINSISKLTYEQARLNTWWDVQYLHAEDVYIVRQPDTHPGYLRTWTTPAEEAPYFFIEDHADRKMSEQVRLTVDAMLFLEIKAEESGIETGVEGLLSWFSSRVADAEKEQLDLELLLEFQRWRQGCTETPSVSGFRAALDKVESQAEYDAIMAGDYTQTLSLQLREFELEAARGQRKAQDTAMMAKAQGKADLRSKRAAGKRAAEDGVQEAGLVRMKRTRNN